MDHARARLFNVWRARGEAWGFVGKASKWFPSVLLNRGNGCLTLRRVQRGFMLWLRIERR